MSGATTKSGRQPRIVLRIRRDVGPDPVDDEIGFSELAPDPYEDEDDAP